MGVEGSERLFNQLQAAALLDDRGTPTDTVLKQINEHVFVLPEATLARLTEEFESQAAALEWEFSEADLSLFRDEMTRMVAREIVYGRRELPVHDETQRQKVSLVRERFMDPAFQRLWDRIRQRTTYRVSVDSEDLIAKCVAALADLSVPKGQVTFETHRLDITGAGVASEDKRNYETLRVSHQGPLPDIVRILQDRTKLTRKAVVEILLRTDRLGMFKRNPQAFADEATKRILAVMQRSIVDGIKYVQLDENAWYSQELFTNAELSGVVDKNMVHANKSVFDYVVYDSAGVEKGFAEGMERDPKVKWYAKLPPDFKINTPLGGYNPDWAIVVEEGGREQFYFVVETKGNEFIEMLTPSERSKILCGRAHFEALNAGREAADRVHYSVRKAWTSADALLDDEEMEQGRLDE